MKTVTLRLGKDSNKLIEEIKARFGQKTGSKAVEFALFHLVASMDRECEARDEVKELKQEIEELKATIKHLR